MTIPDEIVEKAIVAADSVALDDDADHVEIMRAALSAVLPDLIAAAARERAQSDAVVAVAVLRAGNAPTIPPANDPPAGQTIRFGGAPPERGAVTGSPGWFWWEQAPPPAGVTIEYRHMRALHSVHRQPSSISPVSLNGMVWRIAE